MIWFPVVEIKKKTCEPPCSQKPSTHILYSKKPVIEFLAMPVAPYLIETTVTVLLLTDVDVKQSCIRRPPVLGSIRGQAENF